VQKACVAMLKRAVRQQRHKLKQKYFDAFPLHLVPKTSPVSSMSDGQWDTLVAYWKNENKMVSSCHFVMEYDVSINLFVIKNNLGCNIQIKDTRNGALHDNCLVASCTLAFFHLSHCTELKGHLYRHNMMF
jgi:hypothetical protein